MTKDAPKNKALDPKIVSRVARVLWVADMKKENASISGPELQAAWKANDEKPRNEARRILRHLERTGLTISLSDEAAS